MTVQHHHGESLGLAGRNRTLRKYLEVVQDIIVLGLCMALFIAMLIKLLHLGRSMLAGTDFSVVIADILFHPRADRVVSLAGHPSGRA